MRIFFWIFSILWIGVAFCQLMVKGVDKHAGAYTQGYWGMRYTEGIVGIEILLLTAVGLIVHQGPEKNRALAMTAGILGCLMLLMLQMVTYKMDTGYIYRKKLAGDQYQIPWRYHPSGSSSYSTIGIWVVYPGFSSLEEGRAQSQTKVWFQKSPEGSRERPHSVFENPRQEDVPECASSGNWVYCRFYRDGFWYEYSYPTDRRRKIEIPIAEAMKQLPMLLDSFVESRP